MGADVPRLIAACEAGADLTLGSRYVAGGGTENWGLARRFVSAGGSFYARAQNVALALRQQYDQLLSGIDLLLMPTTCIQAPNLPSTTVPDLAPADP